jgi:hypothetical protein
MYNWNDEFMAEYHRQTILQEADHIRLERIAVQSRAYRPGVFERTMISLADWMISTGKQLRERYEVPCTDCPAPSGSFAR